MLNAEPESPALPEATMATAAKKRGGRPKGSGVVDATPKKAGAKRGPKPRSKKDEGGIREL
ncbi:MAG TPA: hypothetical protein PLI66_10005, partial [Spirochaetales bacterium]|nr:hypothetical protein [Spirochaetales bacterium]